MRTNDESFVTLSRGKYINLKGKVDWLQPTYLIDYLYKTEYDYDDNGEYFPKTGELCNIVTDSGEYQTVQVIGWDYDWQSGCDLVVVKTGRQKYESVLKDILEPVSLFYF